MAEFAVDVFFMILLFWLIFKITGFVFRIGGRILGGILGLAGYLALGIIAMMAFGLAVYIVPVVLIIGLGAVLRVVLA